jgi:hypothetical protein
MPIKFFWCDAIGELKKGIDKLPNSERKAALVAGCMRSVGAVRGPSFEY